MFALVLWGGKIEGQMPGVRLCEIESYSMTPHGYFVQGRTINATTGTKTKVVRQFSPNEVVKVFRSGVKPGKTSCRSALVKFVKTGTQVF